MIYKQSMLALIESILNLKIEGLKFKISYSF
jgi:hypothetical protein